MSDTNVRYIKLFGTQADVIDYDNITKNLLDRIADSILSKHMIMVPGADGEIRGYRICEIEFYVNGREHEDPYTHQDGHQKTYGKWYFHRNKSGSYKGGTYKGVDITLGNAHTYFSVLIRSICPVGEGNCINPIEGPCRCVNQIIDLADCKNVGDYMVGRIDPLNARSTKNFHIKRCKGLKKYDIYSGPRVGLSDRYPDYKDLSYRYVIMKDSIQKQKKSLGLVIKHE